MKNRFIPIAMIALLTGAAANAQVGIGELNPSPSSQLEVKATNKGILIPRVSLTGTTDNTTITSGNVNSLLVFNTATTADVTPGYYYWHVDKWVRIMTSEDASVTDTNTTNTSLAVVGGNLVLTDSDGNTVTVPVADINSGANGNTLLNGTTAPAAGVGQDGDFYINTTTNEIYGPKTGGSWGTPTSLVGPQGPQGPAGANGQDGADGKSMLSGTTAPAAGLGQDGDVYVNTATGEIYGPKTGGNWGTATSLVGPQGPAGANGQNGTDGQDGKSVLNGAVAPTAGVGQDGDFYIDTVKNEIYGPKTGGNWGAPTSLVGPAGAQGTAGNGILNGNGAPATATGNDGDFYINTDTNEIYGPKTGGNWGTGTSLVGPGGATVVKDDNATTKVSGNGSTATPYKVEVRSDVKVKTTDYTATMAETVILADASAAQVTITLPAASADNKGKSFIIKKQDNNEDNDVVVLGVTSVSGDKVSTAVPFTGWEFLSDGTDWHIVNKF